MLGYKGGRIVKIKVKDFMTYDDLEIFPKKGLNILIGLNGSGKSSLMSAICLGLAGKPQYTGKSTHLSDFIKHGKQQAMIEIELDDPHENVVVCRIIEGDKSSWLLNGSSASQNEVVNRIKKYNIDVGNLCQFLPQEKVADFSKMDQKQRLEVIIQAIGDPSLHTQFNELKKKRTEICTIEKDLKKFEVSKASQEQQNDRLKVEVEKYEKRQKLQEELETYRLQKTFYDYKNHKAQFKELKKEKKKMTTEMNKIQEGLHELETESNSLLSSFKAKTISIKIAHDNSTSISELLSNNQSLLTDIHGEIDKAKIYYQTRIDDKNNQKLQLEDLQRQIRALCEMVTNNATENRGLQEKINKTTTELEKVGESIGALDSNLEIKKLEINALEYLNRGYQSRIASLQNVQNNQMEFLKRNFRDTYQAVCWLEQNKNSFKSNICLPPLLSMKVLQDENRKFIENMVPLRDLNLFVCTHEDDVKRLTDVLRTQMKLNVNIGLAPKDGISAYQAPTVTGELRRIGVERFASDLFTAPEPVMCYLCALAHLHQIPICNQASMSHVDQILSRFKKFYTSNERVSSSRSRYGSGNSVYRTDSIRPKNLIQSGTNENNLTQLRELQRTVDETKEKIQNLSDEAKSLERQRSIHEREQQSLRECKMKCFQSQESFKNLRIQLEQKKRSYEKKKSEVVDEAAEKEKMNSTICYANSRRMKIAEAMKTHGSELVELKLQIVKDILYLRFLNSKRSRLRASINEERSSYHDLEERLCTNNLKSAEIYSKAQELQEQLRASTLSRACLEEIASMKSIEVVEQNIINIQAQLDLYYEENESVLREYQNLQLSITEICSRIEIYEHRLGIMKADMEKMKQEWLPVMESHIKKINKNFSEYYKFLKCAGEISLETGDDPDDFAEYGLQIRLKHRDNESFSALSPDHHSGGERNVASIVFILSLQELTTVPFRCVDEINQGMDSTNERKMYEFIADDASRTSSCSQYFLLTPKLLMDLNYHKDVAVHIIFNSRFLETKLNIKEHLETVKRN